MKISVLVAVLFTLISGSGCHPTFVTWEHMSVLDARNRIAPAPGTVLVRQTPTVWVRIYGNAPMDLYPAARIVSSDVPALCGLRLAGVLFLTNPYGDQSPPPHDVRLDVSAQVMSDGAYRAVSADAHMFRAGGTYEIAAGHGTGYFSWDGRPHDLMQSGTVMSVHAGERQALEEATYKAVQSVCHRIRGAQEEIPLYPEPVRPNQWFVPYGTTLCGYGASGRVTEQGAWDMRYDCRH